MQPSTLICSTAALIAVTSSCSKDKEEFQKLAERAAAPIEALGKLKGDLLPDTDGKDAEMFVLLAKSAQACIAMKEPAGKLAALDLSDLTKSELPELNASGLRDAAGSLDAAGGKCATVDPMVCIEGCSTAFGRVAGWTVGLSDAAKVEGVTIPRIDID
jgi:hypothetical protein